MGAVRRAGVGFGGGSPLGRKPYVAEIGEHFARLAEERLRLAVRERDIEAEGATVAT